MTRGMAKKKRKKEKQCKVERLEAACSPSSSTSFYNYWGHGFRELAVVSSKLDVSRLRKGLRNDLVQFLCSVGGETEAQGGSGTHPTPELIGPGPGLKSRPRTKLPALPPHCTLHKLFRVSGKGEFTNLATFWNNRAINGHARGRLGGT